MSERGDGRRCLGAYRPDLRVDGLGGGKEVVKRDLGVFFFFKHLNLFPEEKNFSKINF